MKLRVFVLLVAALLIIPACGKPKTSVQPGSPTGSPVQVVQPSQPAGISDDALKKIEAQVERAKDALSAVNAAKRGLFRDKLITGRQSKAITDPSKKILSAINAINSKITDLADLDPTARSDLTILINAAIGLVKDLTDQGLTGIPTTGLGATIIGKASEISGFFNQALSLAKGGN